MTKCFLCWLSPLPVTTRTARQSLTPAWLEKVRQGALILLYRLLFVLYAEDRDLLPDESGPYGEYASPVYGRKSRSAAGARSPASPLTYWAKFSGCSRRSLGVTTRLGIPDYNGGLFENNAAPILERCNCLIRSSLKSYSRCRT